MGDQGARGPGTRARYRDYFHVFTDEAVLDAYEQTLPEVFPDFAPGNFTWDDDLQGWVWTTFNEFQWDLNWANPSVLLEFAEIILGLANLGVEVLRLDAIAFLWKRLGTSCQNQPEVHAITQALRAVTRIAAPAVAFKAEAIVGPRDLVQYLGTGTHAGRVSDLAYHNSLMVQVWSMLAARNTVLARQALGRLPASPATGTWITYVRCHDDIGWAIDDRDAHAVGVTGHGHRAFLSDWYSGEFPDTWADGLVFQANPATGDRRISGTAASLRACRPARSRGRPSTTRWPGSSSRTRSSPAGAGSRSSGAATSWPRSTTRTGRANPATRTTTAGRTGPGSTGRARSPGTTCAPSRAGCSPASSTSPRSAPGCRSCTRRPTPRSSRTPTTACSPWCAGTPAAPSSASTTSPSRPAPSSCTGSRTPG